MPEISQLKRVQLAVSCCRGSRRLQQDKPSHYRYRKFRDQALLFVNSQRFFMDPFDSKGQWLLDLEDCETLFDGQCMISMVAVGLRKGHLRINQASQNDTLVTVAEFARRLLFDKESKHDATEVIKRVLLTMNLNGMGNYAQLFHPQEISLITGC